MEQKQINQEAKKHAQTILGAEQYSKNKLAAKSIEEDFKAGFKLAANLYQKKSEKWDALDDKIAKCYETAEDSDEDEDGYDLISVGEIAASAFGYL